MVMTTDWLVPHFLSELLFNLKGSLKPSFHCAAWMHTGKDIWTFKFQGDSFQVCMCVVVQVQCTHKCCAYEQCTHDCLLVMLRLSKKL